MTDSLSLSGIRPIISANSGLEVAYWTELEIKEDRTEVVVLSEICILSTALYATFWLRLRAREVLPILPRVISRNGNEWRDYVQESCEAVVRLKLTENYFATLKGNGLTATVTIKPILTLPLAGAHEIKKDAGSWVTTDVGFGRKK